MLSPSWIASIPSPSFNTIDLGPRPLTLYGLMIGLGIIAATMISRPRAVARGLHPDTPVEMLMWVIPAGVVGARMYHVLTDGVPIENWIKIWEGGLGIPGGILGGLAGSLLFIKRNELDAAKVFDTIAPGVALAQAIGRWGNWWNQELYGRPTDLPWGLEIDAEHRIVGFGEFETFHPTFLYESLWNLALCAFLIWLDRTKILKPGKLGWVYAGTYAIGRLWIEALRIDPATEIAGIRVNLWTMGIVVAVSSIMLRNGFLRKSTKSHDNLKTADTASDEHDLADDHAEDEVADDRGRSAQRVSLGEEE